MPPASPQTTTTYLYTPAAGTIPGPLRWRSGQKLIGQGASASLLTITGYAAPSGTNAIPATGGTNPVLTTTVANTNALTLGSGNTLRGFTIGNTTGSKIAGTNFGTLTASEVTLNGNGQALNLTNGTLAATFTSIASGSSAAAGISLSSVAGNLTSGTTTITNPTGQGINVSGMASTGTFNFGTTSITGSGGAGLSSTGFANTLQFGSLTIDAAAGQKAIDISGATGILNATSGVISDNISIAGNSSANRVTLGTTFTSISSTNSTTTGISLSNVAGNLTSGTTTITNPTGQGINVSGTASTGTFNFGTTSLTGSGGAGLASTGFANTLQFSSLTNTPDDGQKGIDITGATGTLTIPTGSISTSNNSALSIAGVSSASRVTLGVTLTSVSVNAPSGTSAKGISLNNTSGNFQVAGGTIQNITQRGIELINSSNITLNDINLVNANTTNGTIDAADYSTANAAIYLNGVTTVSLNNVDVSGTTVQRGLNGKTVQNLTMTNCDFINCGNEVQEGCMALQDLSGTCSITTSTFKKSYEHAVQIYNTSTTLGLTISGSTIDETSFGTGLLVDSWGSSNTKITVTNSTFTKIPSDAIKTINNETSIGNYDVSGCTVDPTNSTTSPNDVGTVMEVASNETSVVYINIHDNLTLKGKGGSLINLAPAEQSTMHGKVNNNTLTYLPETTGTAGRGIDVFGQDDAQGRFSITDNRINNIPISHGIAVFNRRGTEGRVDATITGNTINMPQAGTATGYNILLEAGNNSSSTGNIVCGNVANNTIPAGGKGNNGHFRVSSFGTGSAIRLQGSGADAANVWDNNVNSPTTAGGAVISTRSGTVLTTGQTCLVPEDAPSGARLMADAEIEQNQAAAGESVIPLLADSESSTLLPATPAELLTPVEVVTPVVEEEITVAEPAPLPIAEKTVTTATRNKAAREAATQAVGTVTVNGSGSGFTLPAGKNVTIKFKVTINSNIPNGTCQVSNQGTVSATNFANVLTDDPAVGGGADPTVTPLKSAPVITTAQTPITAEADPNTCTASRSFVVAVAGCPTPTVTYKIGSTTITSPHAFPVGVTTVDVTVSNGNAPDATSSFTVTVSPVPAPVIESAGQPQNQTITEGGNASFTVVAQGTGLTYQWQKKKVGAGAFEDIPAADNPSAATATLNLTAVPLSESGTQYQVVVSNPCGGSTTSNPATLTVNPPISATISGDASVCLNEAPLPLITFTGADGTAPYTFTYKVNNGSNVEITTTNGNSVTVAQPTGTAGTYVYTLLSVKDAADISVAQSGTATITVNSIVIGQPTVTNVSCFGGSNGSIAVSPSGGTAPYTYDWSPSGGTNSTANGLVAGNYTVTVTDAIGCTATLSNIAVTQPSAAVSGTTVVTNVACFGGSTGAINLTPAGGTGPYTFDWGGGITTEDRTGLAAGTYSVTITDANGCTATVSNIAVTQPAAPVSGTTVVTNVACFGGSNGAINLTPAGGTGPYTFVWGGGITTEDRTGLAAGTYSVTITDANGCTGTVSNIAVTQPAAPVSGTTVVTNVACFGGSTGAINLTPAGGTGPYTFDWGGGITTEDRTGLAAGTYSVTITDANGCTGTVSNIAVTQPAAPVSGTTVVTNVACFGGSTGAINLTPAGGTGPYTFVWGGGITTEDRTGLTAGTYSVTITDANGCTATLSNIAVTQPATAVSGTTVVTNVACFGGSNGAINLTPAGGTGPYTFDWGGGITTEDRTGLAAGTYSVTITDANGCTGTVSNIAVTQPAAPVSGTTVVTNVACFGGSNGAINLTPAGGTGPYTFVWGGGITTEDRTGLAAGTYSVTITDANGCTGTVSNIAVTQPSAAVSGTTVVTNLVCFGGSNGAINLTPAGGTGPYTFDWGGGITTEDRTGLTAGTYSVTITDANGCTATLSNIAVTQPATAVSGTTVVTNVACFGGSNGAINLTPAGGTGPYTFDWGGGITTEDRTGLAAGTYSVTITDANGCTGTVSNIAVTQPSAISLQVSGNTSVTYGYGSNCTTLTATASGGTPGFTYAWNNGTQGPTLNECPTQTTTYTVTATDSRGCTGSRQVTVYVNDVRCGSGIKMCSNGREVCVAQYLVPTFQKLGYSLGACGSGNTRISYEPQPGSLKLSITAFPNPTPDQVMVEVLSPVAGAATFEVLDLTGLARQTRHGQLVEGANRVEFRLGALPGGIYLIRVQDALNHQATVRVHKE